MNLSEKIEFMKNAILEIFKDISFKDIISFIWINKFIIGIFIIAGIIIYIYRKYMENKNYNYGEAEVERILGRLGRRYKVINDVMLKTKNGTSQIDHLVVSRKGIYVIETKALNGVLYGSEYERNWTQVRRGEKVQIHNPIKQNEGHIRALEYMFSNNKLDYYEDINYIGVLAFADFTKLNLDVANYYIVRFSSLLKYIKRYKRANLSSKQVRVINKMIKDNNINSSKQRERHIQRIQENKRNYDEKISKKICPVCSNKLKKKRIKGRKFLVCKNCNFKDLL